MGDDVVICADADDELVDDADAITLGTVDELFGEELGGIFIDDGYWCA